MRVASCLYRAHREESRRTLQSIPRRRVLGLENDCGRGVGGAGEREREEERGRGSEWGERDARRCAPTVNG